MKEEKEEKVEMLQALQHQDVITFQETSFKRDQTRKMSF